MQGQDPRGARLAVRARTTGLTAADVDRALNDRSLLITWLNRGTLHLVRSEDYPWLLALTAPPHFTGSARRLAQEGVSPGDADRAVAAIERALADSGPLTRAEIAGPRCCDRRADGGSGARAHHRAGVTARADRARADDRPRPWVRARPGLARRAGTGRPRRGSGRAGPPLPRRPRPRRRTRPRQVGGPPPARRSRGAERDRLRARTAGGRPRRPGRPPRAGGHTASAPARPVRPGAARLDVP